jgi:hypothetical protein
MENRLNMTESCLSMTSGTTEETESVDRSKIQLPTGVGAAAALLSRLRSQPSEADSSSDPASRGDEELIKDHPILFALTPPG